MNLTNKFEHTFLSCHIQANTQLLKVLISHAYKNICRLNNKMLRQIIHLVVKDYFTTQDYNA